MSVVSALIVAGMVCFALATMYFVVRPRNYTQFDHQHQ